MTIYKSRFPDVALSDKTITQRVFEGIDPEASILIDGPTGRAMTGAQFIGGVKSLAGGLTARGYGTGKVVALMAPNIPEYCVAFHASAWAGGTVTTINPTYTAHEVNHQLTDAAADVLVTIAMFADTAREAIKGTGIKEIVIIGDAPEGMVPLAELMGAPMAEQAPVDVAEHVVALPYSSGTTGLPKGVMLTHQNLVVNIDQSLAPADVQPGEMTVAFLPFFHIYGLEVLMNIYLAAGGGLVTMPRFDLEMYLKLVEQYKTPRLWIVPPVALALAKHPLVDQFDLGHVEQVNSAGRPPRRRCRPGDGRPARHQRNARLRHDRAFAGQPHLTPGPVQTRCLGRVDLEHRMPHREPRNARRHGPGQRRRALGARPAGDEGLSQQRQGHV